MMTHFWIGFVWFVVGLFVGTIFGVFIIAICQAAARGDNFGKKDDTYYG